MFSVYKKRNTKGKAHVKYVEVVNQRWKAVTSEFKMFNKRRSANYKYVEVDNK